MRIDRAARPTVVWFFFGLFNNWTNCDAIAVSLSLSVLLLHNVNVQRSTIRNYYTAVNISATNANQGSTVPYTNTI